jgi:hypothetical protein
MACDAARCDRVVRRELFDMRSFDRHRGGKNLNKSKRMNLSYYVNLLNRGRFNPVATSLIEPT